MVESSLVVEGNQRCAFFDRLPREMRDEVYRLLLVYDKRLIRPREEKHEPTKVNISLLLTSREVKAEAEYVFYGENTFRITQADITSVAEQESVGKRQEDMAKGPEFDSYGIPLRYEPIACFVFPPDCDPEARKKAKASPYPVITDHQLRLIQNFELLVSTWEIEYTGLERISSGWLLSDNAKSFKLSRLKGVYITGRHRSEETWLTIDNATGLTSECHSDTVAELESYHVPQLVLSPFRKGALMLESALNVLLRINCMRYGVEYRNFHDPQLWNPALTEKCRP